MSPFWKSLSIAVAAVPLLAWAGVAVVSATAGNCTEVLEACERLVAGRPEIELLSARQRLFSEED